MYFLGQFISECLIRAPLSGPEAVSFLPRIYDLVKFDLEIKAVSKVHICLETRAVQLRAMQGAGSFSRASQGPALSSPLSSALPAGPPPPSPCLCVRPSLTFFRARPASGSPGPPWASSLQLAWLSLAEASIPALPPPQRPSEDPASHPPPSRLHPSPWGWFSHLSTFGDHVGSGWEKLDPQTPTCSGGPEDSPAQPSAVLSPAHLLRPGCTPPGLAQRPLGHLPLHRLLPPHG